MCKVGDIILVRKYVSNGVQLKTHSFIIIDDQNGEIQGLSYDYICNVLSSLKSKEQRIRKLSYPGNYELKSEDMITSPHNGKDAFIKTDQLYFFKKDLLDYRVIGHISNDAMDDLLNFIENASFEFEPIIDNL